MNYQNTLIQYLRSFAAKLKLGEYYIRDGKLLTKGEVDQREISDLCNEFFGSKPKPKKPAGDVLNL